MSELFLADDCCSIGAHRWLKHCLGGFIRGVESLGANMYEYPLASPDHPGAVESSHRPRCLAALFRAWRTMRKLSGMTAFHSMLVCANRSRTSLIAGVGAQFEIGDYSAFVPELNEEALMVLSSKRSQPSSSEPGLATDSNQVWLLPSIVCLCSNPSQTHTLPMSRWRNSRGNVPLVQSHLQ